MCVYVFTSEERGEERGERKGREGERERERERERLINAQSEKLTAELTGNVVS